MLAHTNEDLATAHAIEELMLEVAPEHVRAAFGAGLSVRGWELPGGDAVVPAEDVAVEDLDRVSGGAFLAKYLSMGLSPVAGHPAVAVFREPRGGRPVPELGRRVELEAQRTARLLAGVATHARPSERSLTLRQCAAVAVELVASLSDLASAVAGEGLPAESISQSYFRVRECELSDQQAALHGLLVIQRGLDDLCEAPLSGADLALEVAGMRQAVLDLTGAAPGADRDVVPSATLPEPGAGASLEDVWSARWLIGHQVHVLFNVCSAVAVADAVGHLRHGDTDAALVRLADATVYVRGFPAAMTHASTIPADYYMAAIRQTMAPPSVDVPLSGRQHRGYKLLRAAMKDLLAVVPDSYERLAARAPELAQARDALLEADIIDGERHVTLAYSMVHLHRSIAQKPEGPDNAVAELRLMRHRRAAQYAPPDPLWGPLHRRRRGRPAPLVKPHDRRPHHPRQETLMPETTPDTAQSTFVDRELDTADTAACERVARTLCTGGNDQVDSPEWVARARDAWEDLPLLLRREIRRFRRRSGPHGTLVIGGLPVDRAALPPTPAVPGSVQRQAAIPAAVLTMVACGLGEPLAYLAEKSGALVQDVVPVPGQETFHGNAGSVRLSFHSENGFHPHPPDYVAFLCLRADHDRRAGMRVAGLRHVLPHLTPEARQALFAPEFLTTPPPSFASGTGASQPDAEPRPVLSGAVEDPDIRMAQLVTTPLTSRAATALAEFGRACEASARTLHLTPGDLVIIDNRVTVHGRTAFHPRYDGADRWLQRTYATTDLRRSRDHRPHDGHILTR